MQLLIQPYITQCNSAWLTIQNGVTLALTMGKQITEHRIRTRNPAPVATPSPHCLPLTCRIHCHMPLAFEHFFKIRGLDTFLKNISLLRGRMPSGTKHWREATRTGLHVFLMAFPQATWKPGIGLSRCTLVSPSTVLLLLSSLEA